MVRFASFISNTVVRRVKIRFLSTFIKALCIFCLQYKNSGCLFHITVLITEDIAVLQKFLFNKLFLTSLPQLLNFQQLTELFFHTATGGRREDRGLSSFISKTVGRRVEITVVNPLYKTSMCI
jgi:hypothetical protein